MSFRLSIKDSFKQWVDKVNRILGLPTVDGAFRIDQEEFEDTNISISGGLARSASSLVEIPSKAFSLPLISNLIIGVNMITNEIEWYIEGEQPLSLFVPIYLVKTNNTRIFQITDARTLAYEANSDEITDSIVSAINNHTAQLDPHPQYVTRQTPNGMIQWNGQSIQQDITIPDNVNALTIGSDITILDTITVTVGENSSWTIN